MRTHVHEETFPASPERMFELLHTPRDICGWWGARTAIVIPRVGGYWTAVWGESDYITGARLTAFDPPRRLTMSDYQYVSKDGPLPFEASFETTFEVEPHPDGSVLRVSQAGFPDGPEADGFYDACDTGWRETFKGIRAFLADEK